MQHTLNYTCKLCEESELCEESDLCEESEHLFFTFTLVLVPQSTWILAT